MVIELIRYVISGEVYCNILIAYCLHSFCRTIWILGLVTKFNATAGTSGQNQGGRGGSPKKFTMPRQTIQSPDRLHKAPTDYRKPPKYDAKT